VGRVGGEHEGGGQGVAEGHRRHVPPDLLGDQASGEQAVAAAPHRLGQGHPEEVGLGQLLPGVGRERLAARLVGAEGVGPAPVGEDGGGQVGDRLLVVIEHEVHGPAVLSKVVAAGP
jgi:hypothetical protein